MWTGEYILVFTDDTDGGRFHKHVTHVHVTVFILDVVEIYLHVGTNLRARSTLQIIPRRDQRQDFNPYALVPRIQALTKRHTYIYRVDIDIS